MNIMAVIAPFVASLWTICAVVLGLVIWATWSGYRLVRGTMKLKAALAHARDQVTSAENAQAFATRYETIAEELGNISVMRIRWSEYRQTLLTSDPKLVQSTVPSDVWFDLILLCHFCSYIPYKVDVI